MHFQLRRPALLYGMSKALDGQSCPPWNTSGETEGSWSPWYSKFRSDIKKSLEMDNEIKKRKVNRNHGTEGALLVLSNAASWAPTKNKLSVRGKEIKQTP